MDRFDLFTILIMHAMVTFVFSIFLFYMKSSLKSKFNGIFYIMMGFLFYSIGIILLTLREFIPYQLYLSVIVGNYILFIGVAMLNIGIKQLFGIFEKLRYIIIFAIVFFISFAYFVVIDHNIPIRILIISAAFISIYGHSAIALYKKLKKNELYYLFPLIYLLVTYTIIQFFRSVVTIINYNFITDFLAYSGDIIFHVAGLLVLFSIFIGIILIINKLLLQENETKLNENESLIDELNRLIKVDFLTGLFNRMSLEEKTHELIEKCLLNQTTFQYILLDINDFKKINDEYGHPYGDQILINFGLMLKNYSENVYRYGGDEFIIIIEDVSIDPEEMIKQMLLKCSTDITDTNCIPYFSYGIHIWKEGQNYSDMMKEADQMMYQNKRVMNK